MQMETKKFPIDLYRHGVRVVIGTIDEAVAALKKDGLKNDIDDVREIAELSSGLAFELATGDVAIWLREPPKDKDSMATLAHEVFHAVSFILRGVGIEHTSDTEEAYAYAYDYLFRNIYSWVTNTK